MRKLENVIEKMTAVSVAAERAVEKLYEAERLETADPAAAKRARYEAMESMMRVSAELPFPDYAKLLVEYGDTTP